MTLYEAISVRVSTRSFDGAELSPEQIRELQDLCREVEIESAGDSPFGNKVRLALAGKQGGDKSVRMGTYGLIANASGFVVPAVARGGKSSGTMEDVGWAVEKVVLELTARGYATCWIGGVFSRSRAAEAVQATADELVPAIIAFGWPSDRRKLADRVVTASARARVRKPLEAIVFDPSDPSDGLPGGVSNGSVSYGSFDEPWLDVVRAVQAGPSASNKQPWRFVRVKSGGQEAIKAPESSTASESIVAPESITAPEAGQSSPPRPLFARPLSAHTPSTRWLLFLDEDKIYNNGTGEVHLQNLDLGIAMRHFQVAAEEKGLAGKWCPINRLVPANRLVKKAGIIRNTSGGAARDATIDAGIQEALEFGRKKGWTACALWS